MIIAFHTKICICIVLIELKKIIFQNNFRNYFLHTKPQTIDFLRNLKFIWITRKMGFQRVIMNIYEWNCIFVIFNK